MAQPSDWQPEFFSDFPQRTRPSPWWAKLWRSPQRFLVLRLTYEDVILAGIAGLMVVTVGFCLGVERGRRLIFASPVAAAIGGHAMAPSTMPAIPQPVTPSLPAAPPMLPRPAAAQPPVSPLPRIRAAENSRYVVQVASYSDRAAAEAARQRLVKHKLQASLVEKGRYYVLYAGGFTTYAQATEAAGQLRSTYRDCFVRKLMADQRG